MTRSKVYAVVAALALAGCASVPGGPAATIGKVRAWWQEICGLGDSTLAVAQHAAEVATRDAGAQDGGDAAQSSGGEAPPSPAAATDASAPEASTAPLTADGLE